MTTTAGLRTKSVEEYLALPYTTRVTRDPTGGYVASVEELPGCVTQGETWEEAGELIRDAMRGWIELRLEDGLPVPEPREEAPPAKMLVRLPRSLHEALTRAAEREGVSLNQFVVYQLGRVLGGREASNLFQHTLPSAEQSLSLRNALEGAGARALRDQMEVARAAMPAEVAIQSPPSQRRRPTPERAQSR